MLLECHDLNDPCSVERILTLRCTLDLCCTLVYRCRDCTSQPVDDCIDLTTQTLLTQNTWETLTRTQRVFNIRILVFALLAPNLCQSVCEIHGGDRSSGRSEASYGGANGKIRAHLSLHCEQTHVRVVSRLFCTHIALSEEHRKMF